MPGGSAQVGEHLRGMRCGLDRGIGLFDTAVHTDHIRYAPGAFCVGVIRRAVCHPDGTRFIAKQVEGEIEFLPEFAVGFRIVEADSQNDRVFRIEFLDSITESNSFNRSTTGIGSGIKPQDNRLPAVIAQANISTGMVFNQEIRRNISYF